MGLGQVVNLLYFRAHPHTASAENALFGVADNRFTGQILFVALALAFKMTGSNAHRGCQPLQFAVAVAFTDMAVLRMIVKNQLNNIAAGSAQSLRVGMNSHPIADWKGTGCNIVACAFHFHNADSAGSLNRQLRVIAQPGDMKPKLVGRLHNGLARFYLIFFMINVDGNCICHRNPHALVIASNLHAW